MQWTLGRHAPRSATVPRPQAGPGEASASRRARRLAAVLGGLSALVGVLGVVGWHTGVDVLYMPAGVSSAVPYTAALTLLVVGAGLVPQSGRPRLLRIPAGILAAAQAGAMLVVIGTGADLVVESRLADVVAGQSPGASSRMTTLGATGFLLVAGGMVLAWRPARHAASIVVAGVAASLTVAVGMVALLATGLGIDTPGDWAHLVISPPYVAAGLIAAGTSLVVSVHADGRDRGVDDRWVAIPAGVGAFSLTLGLAVVLVVLRGHRGAADIDADIVAQVVIVAGVLLGGLVATAVLYAQTAARRGEEVLALSRGLERRVDERTADLRAANEDLEAFAYSVSHDLRAPLRAIDGFSLAVMEDYGERLDAQGVDFLRRTRTATQRMGQLIDGMLALSRIGRATVRDENVDLSAVAAEVVGELRAAEPGRHVEVTIAPRITARGDPRLLRVLIDHLLGNAWKFTATREIAHIRVSGSAESGTTHLEVRDDGIGFDMTNARLLFAPFQSLHAESALAGMGVGLATVLRIARRHHGTVSAEGEPGRGAVFRVTLPRGTPT